MIIVTKIDELYQIKYRYDPYFLEIVKGIPGRRWVPENKTWTIPEDKLGWFLNALKGTVYESRLRLVSPEEDIGVNAELGCTVDIPDIDISEITFQVKEGAEPYAHQLDFMKWAIDRQLSGNRSGFLLADDMGCGKSVEVMNLALYNKQHNKFKHCLIICCINSSKYNWQADIVAHTQGQHVPYILGTRLKRDKVTTRLGGSKEKLEDLQCMRMYGKKSGPKLPYFLILNIEAVRYKEGKV